MSDLERASPGVERKLSRIVDPAAEGPWRLVTVGRLTENKNQQTIIRALPRVVDAGVDAVLDVYGDGPCRPRLERMAQDLGVAERVSFHGSVDHGEVMKAFASADLNLLSTRQEGFGKVLLEGMVHAAVPVFGQSPVAGEISGDGSRGVVVPADDDVAMAAAVVGLVQDRSRWAAMARDARDYAASMTLEAFQDRVREMLERQWGVQLRRSGSAGAPR
jgi:glycosyltransferase involved in cell wall biosynthesis